ncbi:type IV pilus modification protein PilV [Cocleimonas sp. KMM 6892]|uniref:type IV pilus modification protein PilV n=1 Tax=unclassified Cocleimonas TaxID=2639732 RepID=UPI002DB796E0|nr:MULTISPECIES: type IV pilus modification protein PilV [unclassified Cocleimonas]MEB8433832.1 type IV pilus modification protein PilV [Cocleimonas sp. KMM 6892]MEC4716643.1 type IV pilus modification protein PilV [Cocleimonas sp. KMM 6895]MEC4746202.1 type IV pilus modification protein PilV [Cocleimonas sp. KMM 6896]
MKRLTSKNFQIINSNASKQSGFSLIEVMIAALILSIGILGVAGLQIVGMKGTQHSYMKQQAANIVYTLTERMRANRQGVIGGFYLVDNANPVDCSGAAPGCNSSTANCSAANIAAFDLHNVVCGYQATTASHKTGGVKASTANDIVVLSDGDVAVTYPNGSATGDVRIEVQWSERRFGQEEEGEDIESDSLVINTRILP